MLLYLINRYYHIFTFTQIAVSHLSQIFLLYPKKLHHSSFSGHTTGICWLLAGIPKVGIQFQDIKPDFQHCHISLREDSVVSNEPNLLVSPHTHTKY